jgi:hypothetical protein
VNAALDQTPRLLEYACARCKFVLEAERYPDCGLCPRCTKQADDDDRDDREDWRTISDEDGAYR